MASSVFYLRYLRNELLRRRARTVLTLLGLGVGVALVVAISSVSKGLDDAQRQTLIPWPASGPTSPSRSRLSRTRVEGSEAREAAGAAATSYARTSRC